MKNWYSWRTLLACVGALALALLLGQLGQGAQRALVPSVKVPSGVTGGYTFQLAVEGRLTTMFSSCRDLGSRVEVVEYQDGEERTLRKRPGRTLCYNVVLSRNPVSDAALWAWYQDVVNSQMTNARKDCTLTMLDSSGKPVMTWGLGHAWPSSLTTGVKNDTNQLVEELTIAIESMTRK